MKTQVLKIKCSFRNYRNPFCAFAKTGAAYSFFFYLIKASLAVFLPKNRTYRRGWLSNLVLICFIRDAVKFCSHTTIWSRNNENCLNSTLFEKKIHLRRVTTLDSLHIKQGYQKRNGKAKERSPPSDFQTLRHPCKVLRYMIQLMSQRWAFLFLKMGTTHCTVHKINFLTISGSDLL